MNLASIVRSLVIDCGMDYQAVMRLTPNQLLVLAIGEKSDPPDRLRPITIREISRAVEAVKKEMGYE